MSDGLEAADAGFDVRQNRTAILDFGFWILDFGLELSTEAASDEPAEGAPSMQER